jgi:hypothetical protein
MKKIEIIDEVKFTLEDNGQAMIAELGEENLFVRIHSWDEAREHMVAKQLLGKTVKVTIEIE